MYGSLMYYKEDSKITEKIPPCPECKCKAKGFVKEIDDVTKLVEFNCTNGRCGRRLLKAFVIGPTVGADMNRMVEEWTKVV